MTTPAVATFQLQGSKVVLLILVDSSSSDAACAQRIPGRGPPAVPKKRTPVCAQTTAPARQYGERERVSSFLALAIAFDIPNSMRRPQTTLTIFHTLYNFLFFWQVKAITTTPRYFQSEAYDSDLDLALFFGGTTSTQNITDDVYGLDLSSPFNRTAPRWTSLQPLPTAIANAATAIDASGLLHVMGGVQATCGSSIAHQVYDPRGKNWTVPLGLGTAPGPRSGARAINAGDEILYFGGESLALCSSDQYFYNSLYSLDPVTTNWTISTSSTPPVAQAGMAMTAQSANSFILVGGEAVSSNSRASWVSMSQFAVFDNNASSWSYLSIDGASSVPLARSGHSSTYNGSHTFVYGGSLGNLSSTPTFLSLETSGSSLDISSIDSSNDSAAPPHSLYGHSAVMIKNGIMLMAFGLIGTPNSSVFNEQIYLYDTVHGVWLDEYDPALNMTTGKDGGLSPGIISVLVVVPMLVLGCIICLLVLRNSRRNAFGRNRSAYPINRLGVLTPQDESSAFEKYTSTDRHDMEVHLPPWAAMHACHARSKSPPPRLVSVQNASIDHLLSRDPETRDYDVQDVQFACPPSPRVLTFTAPKLQLRVVNPELANQPDSIERPRACPELIETTSDGQITRLPLSISNEDDLETLRIKLSEGPFVDNIDDSLAGLGLVLQDRLRISATGTLEKFKSITRRTNSYKQEIPAQSMSSISMFAPLELSNQEQLFDKEILQDSVWSLPADISGCSSYSPYLDSPRSQTSIHPAYPDGLNSPVADDILSRLSPAHRRSSWSSNSSRLSLLHSSADKPASRL